MARIKYKGPEYTLGLVIDGVSYRPKDMTAKERDSFLKKHPRFRKWWYGDEEE